MAINSTTTSVDYAGDGSSTVFAVSYVFFGADELEVIERNTATGAETPKTLTTHYTVSGGNGATGSVTAVSAPPAGVRWYIRRKTKRLQQTVYAPNDPFPAASHERALDRLTAAAQEADLEIARALQFPKTDAATGRTLPAASARANKALVFDGSGNVAVSADNYVDQAAAAAASAAAATSSASAASGSASAAAASASSAAGVLLLNFTGTSTSSVAIGTGSKSFTTQTGKGFVAGTLVRVTDQAAPTVNFMVGTVTGYVTGTGVLTVNVTETGGSGTLAAWNIVVTGQTGAQGPTGSTGAAGPAGSLGTGGSLGGAIDEKTGADIASAATTNIYATDGNYIQITGTTTITGFGTAAQAGAQRVLRFAGALTLTNGANLILPGGANITTAAGDVVIVRADTTTQHRVIAYIRSSGVPLALGDLSVTARKESDDAWGSLASATTPDLGAQNVRNVLITGTTTITGFGNTGGEGRPYRVRFAGALTLTHNATSLILPGGANIVTAAGDVAEFVKESGTGNWRCTFYQRASGGPVASGGSAPGNVVQATKTDVFSTTSTSYTDITGLSVTITPSSASNRVLVMAFGVFGNGGANASFIQLVRTATAIAQGDAASARTRATVGREHAASDRHGPFAFAFVDSPGTASAVTYKLQMIASGGTGYIGRSGTDSDSATWGRYASCIIAMEVGP